MTSVAKAGELAVALVALTDFAAVWWFATALHAAGCSVPTWLRRAPAVYAAVSAVIAIAFFVITPDSDRFGSQAHGWWAGYAINWIVYGFVTAAGAAVIFWRHGVTMRSPVLRMSILALAVGTSAEFPYLVIRAIRWFSPETPSSLVLLGFWCSFTRFILIALGCSLAALEPLIKAFVSWYRRERLRGIWLLLRQATPDLQTVSPQSRWAEMLTFRNAEELLHQRIIEIYDSVTFLYDGWATPQMLQEASQHAAKAGQPHSVAIACWLEVTRRDAVGHAPKLGHKLDRSLLPEMRAGGSTLHREVRQFLRLHRLLGSRLVQDFAGDFQHRAPAGGAS
ncbi:DUF6545 domain-containing protein [Streptosporangium algeriense]|uniref:DUF6545 domain-containing protein n=1 Tax=Streptosporangium algeriense TaxID=1682748 RepID=A0ABW3DR53_9ACTN